MTRRLTLIIPSTATLGSLVLGVSAIMVLGQQEFLLAAIFIIIGSLLDVLDGQLAERLNATTNIGKELDSLADMVTFGVAPTLLLYHLMRVIGVAEPIAMASSLSFVVAGAYRLARFNTQPTNRAAFFIGMPIPVASLLLITGSFWQGWILNLWWVVAVVTVSYLMVSPFPYPKFKHIQQLSDLAWLLAACVAFLCWIVSGWQAVPFGLLLLYACSGPLIASAFPTNFLFGSKAS
ncbi:CDP-diacylglycerol--serine O-phosphatidyltransferase [Chloroflexi bacterium TSY]|nr:CDP-diacylglycerol--serine O-phosphatidyltransferase [Chloroflexi bacterium TSY]